MKIKLITFFLIIGIVANAQYKFKLKEHIAPASCMLIAGAADGFRDALLFHTDKVITRLNLNPNWWDYRISYVNKYRNNDPSQGQSLGNMILTPVSDGIHTVNLVNHLFLSGTIAFKISQGKKKWFIYIIEGLSYWAVNRIGFTVAYNSF